MTTELLEQASDGLKAARLQVEKHAAEAARLDATVAAVPPGDQHELQRLLCLIDETAVSAASARKLFAGCLRKMQLAEACRSQVRTRLPLLIFHSIPSPSGGCRTPPSPSRRSHFSRSFGSRRRPPVSRTTSRSAQTMHKTIAGMLWRTSSMIWQRATRARKPATRRRATTTTTIANPTSYTSSHITTSPPDSTNAT